MKKDHSKPIASWIDWNSRDYLHEFYKKDVVADEQQAVKYQIHFFKTLSTKSVMLEFGCGPTVHRAIAAAPYVSEIHMADYIDNNLSEVKTWIKESEDGHNWNHYTKYILKCEGIKNPTITEIRDRERLTRKKITKILHCDASLKNPLGKEYRHNYQLVVSGFCADSAAPTKEIWMNYMRNIASLVSTGGYFVTAALMNAKYYTVGKHYFPSANIGVDDLRQVLSLDFLPESITIESRSVPEHAHQGYNGILLAHAIKPS